MKNAPTIDLNNSLEAPIATDSVPSVNAIRSRVKPIAAAAGDTITINVLGRDVVVTCKEIEPNFIEKATMVWGLNVRNQELLTKESLSDILPTIQEHGQQFPAHGRMTNGIIEVADGSRRRATTMIAQKPFKVFIGDFTNEEMAYLSNIGNDYRPPSAWEMGRMYERRLKDEFFGNHSQLSEEIGVDRKIIRRCLETAKLPVAFIKMLKSPNELSARAGERFAKIYEANRQEIDDLLDMMIGNVKNKSYEELMENFKQFGTAKPEPKAGKKPEPRREKFSNNIYADYTSDTHVVFTLIDAPKEAIREVEKILAQYAK